MGSMRILRIVLFCPLLFCSLLATALAEPVAVKEDDKCPVCGMFVAKYPDFTAEVVFSDKSYAVFDGAKDMFKYVLGLQKYDPARKPADMTSFYVTDYYSVALIDATIAFYVVGSDVYGPMGHELIPFAASADAMDFIKDHAGKKMLQFNEVTLQMLEELD